MRNGFSIYDTHTHVGAARHTGRSYSACDLLRDMDSYGVDRSLVIPFPVVDDFRAAHNEVGRAVRDHPDRLAGAACYYAALSEERFRAEIRRCVEEFGIRALKIQPQYQPLDPLSTRADFVFETALEHRLAVICHTGAGAPFALPALWMMPARRFPKLTFVLAHCGGTLFSAEGIVAAAFCPNIFLELSTVAPHRVAEIAALVESSRLMIGSDLPENIEYEIGKVERAALPAEVRADILSNTARRVFHGEGP